MNQTSENEREEQIWSGWSGCGQNSVEKFGEDVAVKFLFSWAKFLKLDTYICWFSCEI